MTKRKVCYVFIKPRESGIVVKYGNKQYKTDFVHFYNGWTEWPIKAEGCVAINTAGNSVTVRYDPAGCPGIKTHKVKSWIEVS